VFTVLGLYLSIGHKSLYQHVMPIIAALNNNNEVQARELTGRIVSRDSETLNIANASIESVLENGNDAVFAALFWFLIAGLPGVIALRLINTLDAMWGYKNTRYLYFGRVAARMDDLMNFIPARLTALSYALLGKTRMALHCWRSQAHLHDSPNAGPVMASGAGALAVTIGGPACYQGEWHQRPSFGTSREAENEDIRRALHLVSYSILLWLVILSLGFGVFYA
jgi:adenosylcobinamide-phosphate synthase